MEFLIRALRPDDYEQSAEIFRQVHRLHQEGRPDIYRMTKNPLGIDYFTYLCGNPDGIALCAECDGQISGIAYTYIKKPTDNPVSLPRVTAFMDDLAVHEDFRGLGIGKALVEETRRLAKARGAVSLELMVWAFNQNAVEFYEHLGMSPRSLIMEMPLGCMPNA
ncbi:MAG: GNAT family N-acetyltransferase [Clostridia bacterium]|nr:GNAT family N-acetyltransferase [Clostridia bacterium]